MNGSLGKGLCFLRAVPIIMILAISSLLLSGCGLASGQREVEQMQVMETMGIDHAPGGVLLTLAPAEGEGPCLSAEGASVSAALERLRELSMEEDVFCGHIRRLLVGEEAAREDLRGILDYVCRSGDLRLEMPVYVLRSATAAETMEGAGGEDADIDRVLRSLETRLSARSPGVGFTAARALRELERSGSTLLWALDFRPASEENTRTAAPAGYAVIQSGRLRSFIEPEKALGVRFLRNQVGTDQLTVQDLNGLPVGLELSGGSLELRPVWSEEGQLQGLELSADVRASLLDAPKLGDAGAEQYEDYLTAQLETAVSRQISAVLQLSKQWKADFLGLGPRLELAAPKECGGISPLLGKRLPELELSIAVRGRLGHTGDME